MFLNRKWTEHFVGGENGRGKVIFRSKGGVISFCTKLQCFNSNAQHSIILDPQREGPMVSGPSVSQLVSDTISQKLVQESF